MPRWQVAMGAYLALLVWVLWSFLLAACGMETAPGPTATEQPAGEDDDDRRADLVGVLVAGACTDAGAVECEPCADAGVVECESCECEPLPSADGCNVLNLVQEQGPEGLQYYAQRPLPRVLTPEQARCAAAELLAIGEER